MMLKKISELLSGRRDGIKRSRSVAVVMVMEHSENRGRTNDRKSVWRGGCVTRRERE